MNISSSQDLLYIVLSLCIVWFTVFLCWLLYQAARVLRNANRIIENVTEKLELISEAMQFIRKKVDGLSGSLGTVTSLVGGLVEKLVVNKLSRTFAERVSEKEVRAEQAKAKKKK